MALDTRSIWCYTGSRRNETGHTEGKGIPFKHSNQGAGFTVYRKGGETLALGNVIKNSGVPAATGKRRGFDGMTAVVLVVFIVFALGTGALAIYAGNKFLSTEPVASNEFPEVANVYKNSDKLSEPLPLQPTPTWVPTVTVNGDNGPLTAPTIAAGLPTAQPLFNDVSAVYAGGENGAMSNELADLIAGNTIVINGVEYAVLDGLTNPASVDMGTADQVGPVCAVAAPDLDTLRQNIMDRNVLRCEPYNGWTDFVEGQVFTAFNNAGEQVAWSIEIRGIDYCFPYRPVDADGILRLSMPANGYIPCSWQY